MNEQVNTQPTIPGPDPATPENPAIKETKKSKLQKVTIASVAVLIISLLLSAFLVLLYYRPQNITDRMLYKTSRLNFLNYKGSVVVSMIGDFNSILPMIPNNYVLSADVSGSADLSDLETPKVLTYGKITVQNIFTSNFELRSFNDKAYLKVKTFPSFGSVDASLILDKWLKFNFSKDKGTRYVSKDNFDPVMVYHPVKVVKKLPDQPVDGRETFHYKINFNKNDLFSVLTYYFERSRGLMDEGDKKTLEKFKERLELGLGEIWIDKKTNYLKKVIIYATLHPSDSDRKKDINVFLDLTFNDFNKETVITEPEGAITIDEMLGLMPIK